MRLSELHTGDTAIIVKILGHGAFRKRVIEMGFVKGRRLTVLLHAPLKDPIKYSLMGYEVSLRTSEADMIEVVKADDAEAAAIAPVDAAESQPVAVADSLSDNAAVGCSMSHAARADREHHIINVALIGNPNCGKTSLFNVASGAREHVGNYSGVTVDFKTGHFEHAGYKFNIVDLPGTYSLSAYSPEELYVRRYLRDYTPDVIINVVDASNIERNLYLTTELIDMDRSMVMALNMYDELRASGAKLDIDSLGAMIGVPMVPVVSKTGEGVDKLFDTIIAVYEGTERTVRHIHVNLGSEIEAALRRLVDAFKADPKLEHHFSPRYLAIKFLERDSEVEAIVSHAQGYAEMSMLRDRLRRRIESVHDEDVSSIIAAEKYGFIAGALAETFTEGKNKTHATTHRIDALVTNRMVGFPLFFLIMFFIFWATFFFGQYPMDWIDSLVGWLSGVAREVLPEGPVKDLIVDGIIGGVGGVIVFLPNILILYFCISFMEDSGYMSRAAFIMDKVMHKVGLHGKSFIPLVMGFGCNVPAVMASRTIESRSSRIITILINPFMSCSARLPIYVLLVTTFFYRHAALAFMGLYFGGIVVAVVTARLLRRFLFKKDETPFVMELPPYRIPTLKASVRHTWAKGEQYLKKMGGIILLASIVVWALNYFPLSSHDNDDNDSYLEMMGKAVNPAMEPLGFTWRGTVAAIAGIPAKEIVVSTLGVLYAGDEDVEAASLSSRLTEPRPETGKPDFTPASALSMMVFLLLYCPCMATVTAIARETGSWRWAAFSVVYNTAVAWLVAFATYRVALLVL
ncbi:MAG: ferrous iron transport protein B [Muribaculaceae bacterium]